MRNLVLLVFIFLPSLALADEPAGDWARMRAMTPQSYLCGRAKGPIEVDGKLDEVAWQAAAWTTEFVDIEGDPAQRPGLKTRVKMMWDDQYFYIAAQLEEPHVWATLTEHDSTIFQDNDFEVFIDPDGDNHQYYEFELNALNTGWDLFLSKPYKDGGAADNSWEIAGLKKAVHIDGTLNNPSDTDRGWSLELALPWQAFQPPKLSPVAKQITESLRPENGQLWRVDFLRVQWQHAIVDGQYQKVALSKQDNWVWSPQGVSDMHRPERWGIVQFVDQADLNTPPRLPPASQSLDPALQARDQLMNVYYHQRVFQEKSQRWATSLAELGIDAAGITLESTADGYVASTALNADGQPPQRWYVQHDARLWSSDYFPLLQRALKTAGKNSPQLQLALESVTHRQREGLEFLIAHMPKRDLKTLSADFLIENVREAYEALEAAPWREAISQELFFNNVLPYASINERRDNWRKDFRHRFGPLVQEAKTPGQAAVLLNQRVYPLVNVKYSTQRKKADQSPYESIDSGLASCTGLSVLLIDACRALGVPARFVGTPLWTDGSGNHSWVEVWDNGWHFTGAAEPNGNDLDKGWFVERAASAKRDDPMHAIYAISYAKTPLKFPVVWAQNADYLSAVNVTDRYTQLAVEPPPGTVKIMFRVLGPNNQRVAAQVQVTLPNSDQTWTGQTNDERFDANDHLGLYLPVGAKLKIQASHGTRQATEDFEVPATGTTLTLRLQ